MACLAHSQAVYACLKNIGVLGNPVLWPISDVSCMVLYISVKLTGLWKVVLSGNRVRLKQLWTAVSWWNLSISIYNNVCYWEWSYTQIWIERRNNFDGECNGDSGCRNIHLPKPWCHSSSVQWTQMTWRLTLQTSVRILLVVEMILFLQAVPETIMSSNVHVFVSKILVANPYENSGP